MYKVAVKLTVPEAFSAVSSDKLWCHSSITCPKHIIFSPLPDLPILPKTEVTFMGISTLVIWSDWRVQGHTVVSVPATTNHEEYVDVDQEHSWETKSSKLK